MLTPERSILTRMNSFVPTGTQMTTFRDSRVLKYGESSANEKAEPGRFRLGSAPFLGVRIRFGVSSVSRQRWPAVTAPGY